ncbi:hypothetical protein RND71_030646 [Anisodus tanguticus]|uniref:Uncharacterized protein n=1 Tax=Anisodus tanguticus TaxID=243964 RepID=A0AAE1RHZ3_9SOLA|nr:hypothetical protein RND71_030646 [Anisodus tanguticus]
MEKTMRMTPEFYSTTLKRKRVMVEQEYEYFLNISVHEGEDIDCVTRHWNGETRIYRVFGWVNPGEEFVTPAAQGLPDPAWNIKYQVPLGRYDPYNYLKLEVVRVTSKSNPGTSSGCILVGKAQIPLPKLGQRKGGRHGLVAPRRTMDSGIVADGHITLAMEEVKLLCDRF